MSSKFEWDTPELMPRRIARLPRDERGYPVPWFVTWLDGKPDFRVADAAKRVQAVREHLCWICGGVLGRFQTYVIGPMCIVNRTTAEPPCHRDCAVFAVIACPFLSNPKAKRPERELPEGAVDAPGIPLNRNPGVTALWTTREDPRVFVTSDRKGFLFDLPDPIDVSWFCEGRAANAREVDESIESGLPTLRELAEDEGHNAVLALDRAVTAAKKHLPR